MKLLKKTWFWISGVVAAGALVAAFVLWPQAGSNGAAKAVEKKPDAPRPVKAVRVTSQDEGRMRQYPGQLRAARRVAMTFPVAGTLTELPAREGMAVKEGDVLAKLDPRDYANQLAAAKATTVEARQNLTRAEELYRKAALSKSELDAARAAWEVADATRQIAVKALEDTVLRAPFSGVVARRYVDNYMDVKTDTEILSLQDISRLEVSIQVPEGFASRLSAGATLRAELEVAAARGRRFPLELVEQETIADSETQTYRLVLGLETPAGAGILPGMTTTVYASVRHASDAASLQVPADAVMNPEGNAPSVWVVDPTASTVSRRAVRLGPVQSDSIAILAGLTGGEVVVTAGVHYLTEGMRVRPLDSEGATWQR